MEDKINNLVEGFGDPWRDKDLDAIKVEGNTYPWSLSHMVYKESGCALDLSWSGVQSFS